jgi:Family of unknown function (DUF6023)
VTSERFRGVLLYALSAVLLIGGGVWYFRSAPGDATDPRVAAWRDTAANLLPDRPLQVRADTIVLTGGAGAERNESVGGGSYTLSMVCLGEHGRVRVRLSASGDDTGRGVPCAQAPQPVSITVGLAEAFYMQVSPETDGAVAVFRWRLDRTRGF